MAGIETRDFADFFHAIHGVDPFPWQLRLVEQIASHGRWPLGLAVPTGSGKTSTIDIAVFSLARELSRGEHRRLMPTRIVFVVDRRIIVDAAYDRAHKLSDKIQTSGNPTVVAVREALATVAAPGFSVLHVERLRGGVPRERDWTPSPAHAAVLLSTVDQVGSRLLFRGYGVSESMRPVHAGLLGADALILLDEVHLSEPFRQTLRAIERMRGASLLPWAAVELSATPRTSENEILRLSEEDRDHPVLRERLKACKPADLVDALEDMELIAERFVQEAIARSVLGEGEHARILVIVNRVALARLIHEKLRLKINDGAIPVALLIGRSRDIDTDKLRKSILERTGIRANEGSLPDHGPYFLVATQTIEAGADVDFDVLVTQIAPLDALRQRFGRLDRSGYLARVGRVANAAIIAGRKEVAKGSADPIYGEALRATWRWLRENLDGRAQIDFGIDAMDARLATADLIVRETLSSPAIDAPTLMPSYIAMLEQTRPTPKPDLPINLFLHGPNVQPADVLVVWRSDIPAPQIDEQTIEQRVATILDAIPPRPAEAIPLPVWVVRRWLSDFNRLPPDARLADLGDIPGKREERDDDSRSTTSSPAVWRWEGGERATAIAANEIQPGDVLVVPSEYGGCDEFGWAPASSDPVADVADAAARPYAGTSFAIRLHPLLVRGEIAREGTISGEQLAAEGQRVWNAVLRTLGSDSEPREIVERLIESAVLPSEGATLTALKLASSQLRIEKRAELRFILRAPYGRNGAVDTSGFVLVMPRGLPFDRPQRNDQLDLEASTEDDERSTLGSARYLLTQHSSDVEIGARKTATQLCLSPSLIDDVAMAGWFHDAGKSDPRFQRYLLGSRWLSERDPLAKSIEPRDFQADRRARTISALPDRWRHEALSVRVARSHERFEKANDPELVLWLIGVHHGWGRPLFPNDDPLDGQEREIPYLNGSVRLGEHRAPHSPEFGFEVVDPDGIIEVSWPALGRRVSSRYGAWTLALFESIIRLADHRASAARSRMAVR